MPGAGSRAITDFAIPFRGHPAHHMMYPLFAVFGPFLALGAVGAAVGVPLVIHLLFRKRYQIVPWAAIRFLVVAERRHKRRIDQWVLLALRVGALALLLFAMIAATPWAEDIWQAIKPGAPETVSNVPRTHHVLVLDASLSMTARTEDGRTRFERAVEQAENLIRSGNRGDGYTLLVMTDTLQTIIPEPSNEPEKVIAALRQVPVTHGPADHAAALGSIAEHLAQPRPAYPRRQLTFFTDLQRASWANAVARENTAAEAWKRIAARADVAVVDTADKDLDNLAVSEITLSEQMPLVDQPVTVTVAVLNLGRVERKNVGVELLLGRPSGGSDSLVSVEQKAINVLPPGARGTVKFELSGAKTFRDRGIHVLQAKLVEGDDLPADDTRARAVEVRDGLHALLVEGKADPDPKRRASTHLSRALYPPDAKPTLTPNRPRTVSPAEFLDPTLCDLADIDGHGSPVDCVFFCDVPNPTADMAAKLEAVLRRGGTVIFGLGANAAASRDQYNEFLYRDGNGVLPGRLGETVTVTGPDDLGFRLAADDDQYHNKPLSAFSADQARAGLISVPFFSYVKMDALPEGRTRRIMSFVRAGVSAPTTGGIDLLGRHLAPLPQPAAAPDPMAQPTARPDPALVEWPRHHGRVYVFTSTFNEDWTVWPALLNYLPFWHEFLKYSVDNPDRHTLQVGDPIEEFFPASSAGLPVTLTRPDGHQATSTLVLRDEAGFARFTDTTLSGLYRLRLADARDHVFAVNIAEVTPGAPTESDLRRIDPDELLKVIGSVQIVRDPMDVKPTDKSGAVVTTEPKKHGPVLARYAVLIALLVLAAELVIAWQFGPARTAGAGAPPKATGRRFLRFAGTVAALVPLAVAASVVLLMVFGEDRTGKPLDVVPHWFRSALEGAADIPAAGPGEGTNWRLERLTVFFRSAATDRRAVAALGVLCVALALGVYWMERRAAGGFGRIVLPALLRSGTFLLVLFVVLEQIQLAFDREGWPEVVILLDTSGSMDTRDNFRNPEVRAKAEELAGTTNLSEVSRLRLAQMLLLRKDKDADWLDRLLKEKRVKVSLWAVDAKTRELTMIEDETQIPKGREAIEELKPVGDASKLGEGVEEVLKKFRGRSLAAIIMFTDGVTTAGDDLRQAANAARDGVPLFLVGVGDTWETPDVALTDLQVEDVVGLGDRIVFEARVSVRGAVPRTTTTVSLKEEMPGGTLEDRGQTTVTLDPSGNPAPVRIGYVPLEAGKKKFVLEVPTVTGETNKSNNRIERSVLVTPSRKIRVLYIEGYPRYDFRFVKVLLERESDKSVGGQSVEVKVLLLDASRWWASTDRFAFGDEFPNRTELFGFDVVILGDVDPKQLPKSSQAFRDLADFVTQKGGGLLFLSGEHGTPAAYADTPLAEVLPVVAGDGPMATRPPEEQALTEGYQPRLTPVGRIHPLFRFASDEAESARIWGNLKPLFWYAKGYRLKPRTSVLAVHPTKPAEGGAAGENHPLVVQQFAGAGPVLFFGFDDTWRWRYRSDEEHFDQFWMQAIRVLSRSRVRRPEVRVLPGSELRQGEKVTVQVRFPIEAPTPPGNGPVRVAVRLTKPGGETENFTLVLNQIAHPTVQYAATLPRTQEGEYRFELIDPDVPDGHPWATTKVRPPLNERDRTEMNSDDLRAAAAATGGGFYTLATATDVFNDMKEPPRVPLNRPCQPVPIWNHPLVYLLALLLLLSEWLLRKRERLL